MELPEGRRAALDENDEFRPGVHVEGEIIRHDGHVGHVLVLAGRDRRAAHARPDGDAGVLRRPPGMGLEHERVGLEHVGIDGRERRAPGANPVAGGLQQRRARRVVQVRGAQHAHDCRGVERGAHEPRLPSTAVTCTVWSPRLTAMTTVSPGWWLRRASVMSYRLATIFAPIAVMMSPPWSPACSAGLAARTPVIRTPPGEPLMSGMVPTQ